MVVAAALVQLLPPATRASTVEALYGVLVAAAQVVMCPLAAWPDKEESVAVLVYTQPEAELRLALASQVMAQMAIKVEQVLWAE